MGSAAKIPLIDMSAEVTALWDELNAAIQKVLRSGAFIGGAEVGELEKRIANYLGSKHAIALNSGTDALVIALRAMGVEAGDEVITTPFTFFATAEAVSHLGAKPVFVDVDPDTFNIDPALIDKAVTAKTRAIIPVHLFGQAAEMRPIMALAEKRGLKVLEDVAQAFGSAYGGKKLGAIGHAAAHSFFPTKNLGCYGDGGMLTTDDDRIAELSRMLRTHGAKVKYQNELVGYNSRLDTIQAAILSVKLPHLDRWLDSRRAIARRYDEGLSRLSGIVTPKRGEGLDHSFYAYTIRVTGGKRDELRAALAVDGIETMIYYPTPVHRLPLYRDAAPSMKVAERLAGEVLSLPIWPNMPEETQATVLDSLKRAVSKY